MLKAAYDAGVNYFDTAMFYSHFNNQATLGRAVKLMDREKVMVSTKIPLGEVKKTEDFRRMLEEQLSLLDMDYIDFYHFHGISKGAYDDIIAPLGLRKEAEKAIDEGLIRHMSFSWHGDANDIPYVADKFEIFASCLLQYNLLDRSNEKNIDYLAEKGVGVVVMGPVAGGRLSIPNAQLAEKLLGKNISTPELALRFILGNKNVSCALSGMGNMQMLEENLKTAELDMDVTSGDFEKAGLMMEELKKFSDLYCTGCNYCMPCPKEINIPSVFNAYTYHNVYGLTDQARNMWGNKRGADIADCVNCGVCNEKCPQKIDVMAKLQEVAQVLNAL